MAPSSEHRKKVTIPTLYDLKAAGEPVAWLTAYDYPTALIMDRAGIEMILVGDSVGMAVLGYDSTLPVTMDEMIIFTSAVCRAASVAFIIGDMPYMSYQIDDQTAVRNAGRFMAECGTDAVKLEGGARVASTVQAITNAGIPVMGHIGLTPQSYTQLGGYRPQGRTAQDALTLIRDATVLEEAGAFAVVLECIPAEVTGIIHERLTIPVYGIGSGPDCDGQILIVHDMLGLFEKFVPKFVKKYMNLSGSLLEAFESFRADVKSGAFPKGEHTYSIGEEELEKVREMAGAVEAGKA
jgi:3-methyl-2-oxobutanoate hydroxymethyltransferase